MRIRVRKDLLGRKFVELIVIGSIIENNKSFWQCECSCGILIKVTSNHLTSGHTKSCGHLKKLNKGSVSIDLTGKIYSKLTCLSKSTYNEWFCKCECGKIKRFPMRKVKKGIITSCGCDKVKKERSQIQVKENLVSQKFERLTVLNRADDCKGKVKYRSAWNCQCDCGNTIIVKTLSLKTGNTKSCGCLKIELNKIAIKKAQLSNKKYDPVIYIARTVWGATYRNGISFENFFRLSQKECFYCGINPIRKVSYYKDNNIFFIYNGLDRIDSNLDHNVNNVVPCCSICNRAKRAKPVNEFYKYINNLSKINRIDILNYREQSKNILMCNLNKLYFGCSVKCTFNGKYNDGDLTIEQFYKLSQLNCYYCGNKPSNNANKFKKDSGNFCYNGLDRLDNNLGHNYNNVITCCYDCNFAKSNISLNEFLDWLERMKNNYDNFVLNYDRLLEKK